MQPNILENLKSSSGMSNSNRFDNICCLTLCNTDQLTLINRQQTLNSVTTAIILKSSFCEYYTCISPKYTTE